MKTSIIIPSRMASTRLPKKPLIKILGKSMIMRVYEQAKKATLAHEVIVATDHDKIYDHVIKNGGDAIITSSDHASGTDRIAEVAQNINSDIIINLQGDEPIIDPDQIDQLIAAMISTKIDIGTQCVRIENEDDLFDFNVVKVARDINDKVLYFSRMAIPANRDKAFRHWIEESNYYRHVGMYAYKRDILLKITKLKPTSYELTESLEQLRWLQNGMTIHCIETKHKSYGVDTEDDLSKVKKMLLQERAIKAKRQ